MSKNSEFLSLDEAADQVAHDRNLPRFSVDRVKKKVAAGKLDVYFFYRGTLGLFSKPNFTPEGGISSNAIFPAPSKKLYFVGHLRSISKPELDVVTTQLKVDPKTNRGISTSTTSDILKPFAVIPVDGYFDDPAIKVGDPGGGYYWGRVKKKIGEQPAMLESTSIIPIDKWLIQSDELRASFVSASKTDRLAPQRSRNPNTLVDDVGDVEFNNAKPNWRLKTSILRYPGYRLDLFHFIKAAYQAGQPLPKARDVLEAWKQNPPPDVQVMPDGLKYDDKSGNPKEANIRAIQQAIQGLLESGSR